MLLEPFINLKNQTHHKELVDKDIFEKKSVSVPVSAGDIIVFDNKLVHGSKPELHPSGRRAIRFAVKTCEDLWVPRGSPIVLARGTENSYINQERIKRMSINWSQVKKDLKSIYRRHIK